jgi:hypothetical protein
MNINQIKQIAADNGNHFFEPGAMRFFNSRILSDTYYSHSLEAYGVVFFVTSERGWDQTRRYTVRAFNPELGTTKTVGELGLFATPSQAKACARKLADGEIPYFGD